MNYDNVPGGARTIQTHIDNEKQFRENLPDCKFGQIACEYYKRDGRCLKDTNDNCPEEQGEGL